MLKNTILKCVICINLLIICLFSLSGCINYIPITPDDSGETSVIQPSDESGKSVNFVVAKGEDLKNNRFCRNVACKIQLVRRKRKKRNIIQHNHKERYNKQHIGYFRFQQKKFLDFNFKH